MEVLSNGGRNPVVVHETVVFRVPGVRSQYPDLVSAVSFRRPVMGAWDGAVVAFNKEHSDITRPCGAEKFPEVSLEIERRGCVIRLRVLHFVLAR